MNANHTPHALDRLSRTRGSVLTARQLREHGVPAAAIAERCRPGGPWRQLLPQVYLLHRGPANSEERLHAALLYAGRDPGAHGPVGGGREAMVTGLAALALHRFSCVPPLLGLPRIDVLVPWQRRLRDAGGVSIHRARELPRALDLSGVPCAPVPRALADAVGGLDDADVARMLLTEAVRGGHCDASAVLAELSAAGLLERPYVAAAVRSLRDTGRAVAEDLLYAVVRAHRLPDPVWNVDLRLPGGPPLGSVDAYWPEHAVAVAVDARTDGDPGAGRGRPALPGGESAPGEEWSRRARQREHLEALGITLIHVTPAGLRDGAEQQAVVIRTALTASVDGASAAYVVVTPR